MLDIETTKGLQAPQITAFCLAFLTYIKARTDKTPILYTGASFAKTHLGKALADRVRVASGQEPQNK
ncbi:hypothetical protein EEL32_10600 [Brevibacillus laterosporus]|nr:hypothetical protein EEL32_10600 [Brevibacillus laterosporus]